MAVTDLPILGMLRTKMQWHQARQRLLAENVANADMPGFRPRDLAAPRFDPETGEATGSGLALAATSTSHMATAGAEGPAADARRARSFEVRPSGNAVNLEEEMLKAGDNQSDYQLAASLYQKSLDALKIAVGKR
ncbi:flagellar basal body rod protein FlgB [Methylobacterium sp. A54F]